MSTMKKQVFPVKRLVMDAMLIAIYVVLGMFRIQIGNALRINIAPFAVILCALTFGPVDGLIVGFMAEFLTQILGPYGLTPTTLLWCVGETARGLLLGLCAMGLKRWNFSGMKLVVITVICCVVTGIVSAFGNTLAVYVDSKMFGYYSYEIVFGVLAVRLAMYTAVSAVMGYISMPIMKALQKSKLI